MSQIKETIILNNIEKEPSNLELNGILVIIRKEDGYVNATALCKAGNKRFADWYRTEQTKDLIEALEVDICIKKTQLINITKGGNDKKAQGSWIHPLLATNLAQWISIDFSIKVSKWIDNWRNIKKQNDNEYIDSLLNIKPDKNSNNIEKQIQLKLLKELNGEIEVKTEFGYIDLLTKTEIIEIKNGINWKHGLGQLCVYSEYFPDHKKRLHLFDLEYNQRIDELCKKYNITVTYE